jgi:negative regulator of genetic competence, sporulation and motility
VELHHQNPHDVDEEHHRAKEHNEHRYDEDPHVETFLDPAPKKRRKHETQSKSNQLNWIPSQFTVFQISRSHYAVNDDMNQRQNPSDEDENSHRNVVLDEYNDEHQMEMYTLAEHPKVIADHQVLSQNVEHNAPRRIILDDVIRFDNELVPQHPEYTT